MAAAVNIVDGHTGSNHVTSDDLAAFNEAVLGARSCVLEYGGDLGLTLSAVKANTAFLATGAGVVAGRRFIVEKPLELALAPGTSGLNRIDVVAARYSKTDAGVEGVSIEVVRGTAAASAAQPELGEDDLPLWRVFVIGTAAARIARIAPVMPPAAFEEYDSDGWHVRKRADGYVEMDRYMKMRFGTSNGWIAQLALPVPLAECYAAHATETSYLVKQLYCSPMEGGGANLYVAGMADEAHESFVSLSVRGRWK